MGACVDLLEYYADIAPSVLRDEPLELPDADFGSRIVPHPAGVVAAVTPWNYPLMQAVCKLAPALAAGCPVLLKPSPLRVAHVPRAGEAGLGRVRHAGGCPGRSDRRPARRPWRRSGTPDQPSNGRLSLFTGSTRGGQAMLGASAPLVRRTGLELGGKSAMIVFEDASLPDVRVGDDRHILVRRSDILGHFGLLVHASVADELTERLREAAAAIRVADPLEEETTMGALISASARDRVLTEVANASQPGGGGATLVIGGQSAADSVGEGLEGGYYVQPTILSDVPLECRVAGRSSAPCCASEPLRRRRRRFASPTTRLTASPTL